MWYVCYARHPMVNPMGDIYIYIYIPVLIYLMSCGPHVTLADCENSFEF